MYLLICVSVNTKEIEIAFFLKKAVSHQKKKKKESKTMVLKSHGLSITIHCQKQNFDKVYSSSSQPFLSHGPLGHAIRISGTPGRFFCTRYYILCGVQSFDISFYKEDIISDWPHTRIFLVLVQVSFNNN